MELHLTDKTITVPDVIYIDQLPLIKLSEYSKMKDVGPLDDRMIPWLLNFFNVMELKERLSLPDLMKLMESHELEAWLERLTAGFHQTT